MKKIIGAALAVMAALMIMGCGSTKQTDRAQNLAGVQQNLDAGLPKWANADFDYEDAAYFLDGYIPSKVGFFASGYGKLGDDRSSEIQARLDARTKLAARIKADMDSRAAATNQSAIQLQVERVSQTLEGSQRIDSFKAEDGTLYVLMYISEENAKKSLKNAAPEYADTIDTLFAEKINTTLNN